MVTLSGTVKECVFHLPTYLLTYLHTYLPTYLPTYLLTYLPTCQLTYLPIYLPTYLPISFSTHPINSVANREWKGGKIGKDNEMKLAPKRRGVIKDFPILSETKFLLFHPT